MLYEMAKTLRGKAPALWRNERANDAYSRKMTDKTTLSRTFFAYLDIRTAEGTALKECLQTKNELQLHLVLVSSTFLRKKKCK